MEFQYLRIENFRRLIEPLEIGSLTPGLNVIAGDNEAGKTTVMQALRVALFDRHGLTGKAAAELQPYGHSVAPEVTLGFRCGGQDYRLWKRFCQRPAARLEDPSGVQEGDAAEDALQALLEFERPGRGATDSRYQGVWGLLWVTQGTTFEPLYPAESARRSLGEVLEGEVGDVLGGATGTRLLAEFRRERSEFWTATGRPSKVLKTADERVAALERELEAVVSRLDEFDQSVNELERQQHALDIVDDPAARRRLREQLDAAETDQTRVDSQRHEHEHLAAAHGVAKAEWQRFEQEWTARDTRIRELATIENELSGLEVAVADAERAVTDTQARVRTAESALRSATAAMEAARDAEQTATTALERIELERSLSAERKALTSAEEEMANARAVRQTVAHSALTREDVDRLRELEMRIARAEAQLEAGATHIGMAVNVPVDVTGDAVPVADGGWRVTGEAVLTLEHVGEIRLRAGGADLEAASLESAEAREAMEAHRRTLDVADANAAEAALQRRERAHATAAAHERVAGAYAPDGLARLRECIGASERRLAELPIAEVDATAADPRRLARIREARERAVSEAQQQLDTVRQQLNARREEQVAVRTRRDQYCQRRDTLQNALAEARALTDDDTLHARLTDRRRALETAQEAMEHAEATLAAEDPETVALRLKTARIAMEQACSERDRLERKVSELRVELQTLGHQGLGEQRVALEAELAGARRERNRLQREAGAVSLVAEALEVAASKARQSFLGPVTKRLEGYLRLLMPDAQLVLNDSLALTGVRRGDREEAFMALSHGTREQFAILVRLAFAELMAERGEPVPVILDDALAFADEQRFEAMKLALARVAERCQVLLLTCRPGDYMSLGQPRHRL